MSSPLFSVVIPSFNRSHLIQSTIRSVLDQTVTDLELFVALDGCTDDTEQKAYEAFNGDPRATLLALEHVGHPSGPRAAGVAAATGRYVAYLDDDDLWHPDHLEELLPLLESGASMASTAYVRVDADDEITETCPPVRMCWHPELQIIDPLFQPSTVAHRAGIEKEVGGWTVGTGFEDWDLWHRLMMAGHRFQPSLAVTVRSLDTPDSRRFTRAQRETVTLASFSKGRDAKRALDALQSYGQTLGGSEELTMAGELDAVEWYDAMLASGDFVFPSGFPDDIERNGRGLIEALHNEHGANPGQQKQTDWTQRLIVVPDAAGCRLGLVQRTDRRSHTDAIGDIFKRRMQRQMAWASRIAVEHGATDTPLWDQSQPVLAAAGQ